MMSIIYSDLDYEYWEEKCDSFNDLFDNEWENKRYIVTGDLGLWSGRVKNVHLPYVYNSIKSAILACNDGFDGYITVSEGKYGKLIIDISHHDGSNTLEIKELNKLGKEMWYEKDKSVKEILNRKGATKNIRFIKTYW